MQALVKANNETHNSKKKKKKHAGKNLHLHNMNQY